MSDRPLRLLFVCLGNICRSPAAEGIMQKLLMERGLEHCIEVDSAGTSSFHIGEPADARMRAAAGNRGIALTSRARMLHRRDFAEFDLILAMDMNNLRQIQSYPEAAEGRVGLLGDFLEESWPREVPDPYYGGDEGFTMVLDMLEAACPKILEQMQSAAKVN